jgi:uncharacterized protein involved in response to NO
MSENMITKDMTVEEALKQDEKLIDIFVKFGFKELANPVMRKIMAGRITIEDACGKKKVNLNAFLQALNGIKRSP